MLGVTLANLAWHVQGMVSREREALELEAGLNGISGIENRVA